MPKAQAKTKEFVVPTNTAQCADLLYKLREKRLEVQKVVEEIAAQENQVREYLINNLSANDATGISGRVATASIERKEVPKVEDWDKLQAFIRKNNRFDMLQRRVSDTAIKELVANEPRKAAIAGVTLLPIKVVSCTKRK